MEINSVSTFQSQSDKQVQSFQKIETGNQNKGEKSKKNVDSFELSDSEKKQVKKLKERDREVRTHENQHKAVAGQYARGVTYSYQTGPDNQRYAIGGQVNIDTSSIPNDPEKTIVKMKQIKRSALAPAKPSGKDKQIAAMADREISSQQAEIMAEKSKTMNGYLGEDKPKIDIYF